MKHSASNDHEAMQPKRHVSVVPVVESARLLEGELIAKAAFGFSDRETIPAWHTYASVLFGGVALAAEVDGAIVGFAHASPVNGEDGRFLFLAELAVSQEHQSAGIGLRLLDALRDTALERGYARIKLTTSAVSSRNLYIYVARCRARIVGIRPMMYEGLMAGIPADGPDGDEVEIDWHVKGETATARPSGQAHAGLGEQSLETVLLTHTVEGDGIRHLTAHATASACVRPRHLVEVPWDVDRVRLADADVRRDWRNGVRATVTALIASGYQGVDVVLDRDARRSFVVFQRVEQQSSRAID